MGWMIRGVSLPSHICRNQANPHSRVLLAPSATPNPNNGRRELAIISVLIDQPTEGLILFEIGDGKDYPAIWGAFLNDIFARMNYSEEDELPAAIAKTGNHIKDIKAVIIGHLHLDHAGGLDTVRGTDGPVYVHKIELKHAF